MQVSKQRQKGDKRMMRSSLSCKKGMLEKTNPLETSANSARSAHHKRRGPCQVAQCAESEVKTTLQVAGRSTTKVTEEKRGRGVAARLQMLDVQRGRTGKTPTLPTRTRNQ